MNTQKKVFLTILFSSLVSFAWASSPHPERVSLVDTGSDLCAATKGGNCDSNKNILFRGSTPFPYPYDKSNPTEFYEKIWSYIQDFKTARGDSSTLPKSLEELKSYRIVMINLIYGGPSATNDSESDYFALTHEYKGSGQTTIPELPLQHHLYGLNKSYSYNTYAFQWWPVSDYWKTFPDRFNAPDNTETLSKVIARSNPQQSYFSLDLPYLITGKAYVNSANVADEEDVEAKDLTSLLLSSPKDNHPLLIYYHCRQGKDRTGLVTLAYYMTNGGYANIDKSTPPKSLQRSNPLSLQAAIKATTNANYPKPGTISVAKTYCLIALHRNKAECLDK